MKLTKKIIAVFTALIMLFASAIIAFAESEFLISINDVNAKAGDEVQFIVELKNNPGIGIITLNIGYDESVLTLKEATDGALKKTFNFNYRVDSDKNPIVVNGTMRVEGDDAESGLNKNDGELVILTFVVTENAANGDYPISLTTKYCADDFGRPVMHTLKNGVLTIKNTDEHQHKYTSSVIAPTCMEKGYTLYTCECGNTYKDNYVDTSENHIDNDKNYKCDACGAELEKPPVINDKYSLGDINNDGKITASDARTILRTSAKLETLSESQMIVADIDSNGKISASDARIALRISAKLDSIDNYIKNEPPVDEPPVDEPPVDERIDLAVYLGWHVDDFTEERPEFKFDEDGHAADGTVAIELDSDGYICDIVDTGSSKYSIFGVTSKTPYDEAKYIFESNGFVFEDDENAYNSEYRIGLWIFISDEMTAYNIFSYEGEDYAEYELFQYLNCSIEEVESDFGELEFYDETEDIPAHYYYDGIYFYVDEIDIIYMIDLALGDYYELYTVVIGESFYDVTEMLTDSGFYYTCFDESYIFAESYSDGYTLYVSFSEDGVDYVSMYNSYYNLADYHMVDIETLLYTMPYLEKTDNCYSIPEFTFEVDENGYVNAVILDTYNYCEINGVFVGMNGDDVENTLVDYGFTYDFTDEDGDDFYYNSEEDSYMYVILGEKNEVVCVCIY